MFQCKDLLTLPSMAKARIIAGKSGLSNRIRWVYKPENMNFAKWVKGQELLIISTPVIQSKDFDLQAVIKKAKKPYVFVGGGAVISEASDELPV